MTAEQLTFIPEPESTPQPKSEPRPVAGGHPVIDRTGVSGRAFRVGFACNPAYGQGTYLMVEQAENGWTVQRRNDPRHAELAQILLDYLNRPRRVLLTIVRHGATALTDALLTSHEVSVTDGPSPFDSAAWREWLKVETQKWLAENGRGTDGSFRVLASDLDVGCLEDFQGFWKLAALTLPH